MWSTPKAAAPTIKSSHVVPPSKVSSTSLRPTTSTTKSSSVQSSFFATQPMQSQQHEDSKDIVNPLDQIPKDITTLPYTTVSSNAADISRVTSSNLIQYLP